MGNFQDVMDSLRQKRDELKVQAHLGSMEAKEEWNALEQQWDELSAQAEKELEAGSKVVSETLDTLGQRLKNGYGGFVKKLA